MKLSCRLIGGFLTLCGQYCFVLEDDDGVCGYVVAAPDATDFHQKMALSWLIEMKEKYPLDMSVEEDKRSPLQVCSATYTPGVSAFAILAQIFINTTVMQTRRN